MNSDQRVYINHDGQIVTKSGNVTIIKDGKPVTYSTQYRKDAFNQPRKTRT